MLAKDIFSKEGVNGYDFSWPLKLQLAKFTSQEVMTVFKTYPEDIFPFDIRRLDASRGIEIGGVFNLYPLVVRREPVEVIDETITSFTFISLPGHIHGQGATIQFSVLAEDDQIYLNQEAIFTHSRLVTEVIRSAAGLVWARQAVNLARKVRSLS